MASTKSPMARRPAPTAAVPSRSSDGRGKAVSGSTARAALDVACFAAGNATCRSKTWMNKECGRFSFWSHNEPRAVRAAAPARGRIQGLGGLGSSRGGALGGEARSSNGICADDG